jgi:hypothetical protein
LVATLFGWIALTIWAYLTGGPERVDLISNSERLQREGVPKVGIIEGLFVFPSPMLAGFYLGAWIWRRIREKVGPLEP